MKDRLSPMTQETHGLDWSANVGKVPIERGQGVIWHPTFEQENSKDMRYDWSWSRRRLQRMSDAKLAWWLSPEMRTVFPLMGPAVRYEC